jgi:putative ABC transport system permease protein
MHRLLTRIRALWHWRRNEAELDEEIRFHLAEEEEERRTEGLTPDEAHLAAQREFGNVPLIREKARDAWGWSEAERVLKDASLSLRSLRRQWGFSAIAVLTLALGIGATTAVLSIVNALLIRSLPFDQADELVQVYATTPARNIYRDTTSFWDFTEWKKAAALSGAAAFGMPPMILTGAGSPQLVNTLQASHDIFDVLGVQPVLGRRFTAEEQRAPTPVAVLSHGLWADRYGSDSQIAGKTVVLDETPYTVVGVMPPGFQFPAYANPAVVLPIQERPCRSCGYVRVVARLATGATTVTAQGQLDQIAAQRAQAFPDSNAGRGVSVIPLADAAVGAVRSPILLLLAASGLVLLIGCANVGNLILARGLARSRELAVRSTLGAGAGRLVRQLLVESIVLALVAAALGLAFAVLGRRLLIAGFTNAFPMPPVDFDWAVLSFTALLAVATGVLSGVPLALMVWRTKLADALKEDGRSQSLGTSERRLGNVLVAGQTALAMVLLTTAALFTIEFIGVERIDVGLDTTRSLSADLLLSRHHADPARRQAYTQRLLDQIAALPGVRAVAAHGDPPFNGGRRETFSVDGREDPAPDRGHPAGFDIVTDRFFDAMGIRMARGRAFTPQDTEGAVPVAIVNDTMARAMWPGDDPIGKRLRFYYERSPERWLTIVGVTRDVRYRGRIEDPIPQVFVPASQRFYKAQPPQMSLVTRTDDAPALHLAAVRERIWAVEKDQAIIRLRTLDDILASQSATWRAYATLLVIYAGIALVIAGAGVYALNAYMVTRRTREIGIRLAIGATSRGVVGMILRQSMTVIAIGLAAGVAGSIALGRVTMRFVGHFASPTSVPMLSSVLVLFIGVALLAALVPALRAMRVDPAIAFRAD